MPVNKPAPRTSASSGWRVATAMEARCYNGGNNRTKMKETHMSKVDLGASIVFVLAAALIMAVEFLIEI